MNIITLLALPLLICLAIVYNKAVPRRMKASWQSKLLLTMCLAISLPGIFLAWQGYVVIASLMLSICAVLAGLEQLLRYLSRRKD